MTMKNEAWAGIDIGSAYTKSVVMDGGRKVLGFDIRKSGVNFCEAAENSFAKALSNADLTSDDVVGTVATGYGRKNVSFADSSVSEISCHAKGCYYYFPYAINIIDIGGQDNKVISVDKRGRRTYFKMNRKCAAGTGAFLDEMSTRLGVPISQFNNLAEKSNSLITLNSYCTVFAGTEVLELIRQGARIEDIVRGIFLSILKRVNEMAYLEGRIVATGGVVAHNPFLVSLAQDFYEKSIMVPEYPQLTGAIGAALMSLEATALGVEIAIRSDD